MTGQVDSRRPADGESRRSRRHQPQGIARHGKLRRASPWRTLAKGVVASVAVLGVAGAALVAIDVARLAISINDNAVDISGGGETPTIGALEGSFNVLVVGVDNTEDQGDRFGFQRDATLNDVNILLHVSEDHTQAVAVSIPRDLITNQPECTDADTGVTRSAVYNQPFNTAYARGGLACVVASAEEISGLEIGYAAQVGFDAVIDITDAIGGVPVCLAEAIDDRESGLSLPAGTTEVSGDQALAFLRNRHGVGDGSDLARIGSQQQYMASLLRELKSSETLLNPARLYSIAEIVTQNARVSSSLANVNTLVSMANVAATLDLAKVTFVQYPGSTGNALYPGKVVPYELAAAQLFEAIDNDEAFGLPEDALLPGSVRADDEGDETSASPTPTAEPSEEPTSEPESTQAASPSPSPSPSVIDGLRGSTAETVTCASAG